MAPRPWPLRRWGRGAIISSISPVMRVRMGVPLWFWDGEDGGDGEEEEGVRKRFTSPIIEEGESAMPGVSWWGVWMERGGDDEVEERGRQAMNVNLSTSVRQLRCMAYSSERVSGSEAVSTWICWAGRIVSFLKDEIEHGWGERRKGDLTSSFIHSWYVGTCEAS